MNFDIKYLEETLLLIIEEALDLEETKSNELAPVRDSVVRVKSNRIEQFDHLAAIYYIKDKDFTLGLSDDMLEGVDYAKIVYDTIVSKIKVNEKQDKYKDSYAKKSKKVSKLSKPKTDYIGVVNPPKVDKYQKEKEFNNRVINVIGNELIRLSLKRKNAHRPGVNTSDGNKVLAGDIEEYELLLKIRDILKEANYSQNELKAIGNLAYGRESDVDSLIILSSRTKLFRDKEIPERKKDIVTRELLEQNKTLIKELVRYIEKMALRAGNYEEYVGRLVDKTIAIDGKSWIVPNSEVLECNKIITLILMLREQVTDLVDVWGIAGYHQDKVLEFQKLVSEIKYFSDRIPKLEQNESKITEIKSQMLSLINKAANDGTSVLASNGVVLESDFEKYQLLEEQLGYLVSAIASINKEEISEVLVDRNVCWRYQEIEAELNSLEKENEVQEIRIVNNNLNQEMLNVLVGNIEELSKYKSYGLNNGLILDADAQEELNLLGVLARCLLDAQNSEDVVQIGNIWVQKEDKEEVICVIKRLAVKQVVKSYLGEKDDLAPIYEELLSLYQKEEPVIDVPFREVEKQEAAEELSWERINSILGITLENRASDLEAHDDLIIDGEVKLEDKKALEENDDDKVLEVHKDIPVTTEKREYARPNRGEIVAENLGAIKEILRELESMQKVNWADSVSFTSDKKIVQTVNAERYENLRAKLAILENAREFDEDLIDVGSLKIKIKDLRFYNAIDAKLTENKLAVLEKKKKQKPKRLLPIVSGVAGLAIAATILFSTYNDGREEIKDGLDDDKRKVVFEDIDIHTYNKFNRIMGVPLSALERFQPDIPVPTNLQIEVNLGMRREKINLLDIYSSKYKEICEHEKQNIREAQEMEEALLRKKMEREAEEKRRAEALEQKRTEELIALANSAPKKDVDSALNRIVNSAPKYSELLNADFYSLGLDDKIQFVLSKYNISYSDFNDISYGRMASDYAAEIKEYREAINVEMLRVILEREGLSANQFDVVQAVTQAETSVSYDDTYWTINSIDNRLHSKQWTDNGKRYLSLYAQVTRSWQYEVYYTTNPKISYRRYLGVTNTINYQAVIDYCYFKASVMDYMSFRSWGTTGYSDVYVCKRGNRYGAVLTDDNRLEANFTR